MLIHNKNYSEGRLEIEQALKLDPNCALAYRQRGILNFREQKNLDSARVDIERAISLDPNDSLALYWAGHIFLDKLDYANAIQYFSKSLEFRPNYKDALKWRAYTYECIDDLELAIVDRARYYQIAGVQKYSTEDQKFNPWMDSIYKDITEGLMPLITRGGETFVEYWPCYFLYDNRTETRWINGSDFNHYYGTFGTGYLCLTDKNIRIVTIGHLSREFPLFKKENGAIKFLAIMSSFSRSNDHRTPEVADKVWVLPNHSVSNARIVEGHINLSSAIVTCELYEGYSGVANQILTGINMAMFGKLAQIWSSSQSSSTPSSSSSETMDTLKKLGELKMAGIITETEFETKKKELLARL